MFVFDIETLGIESTSVVLSASIIHFDMNEEFTYNDLLYKSMFVKFNVEEQVKIYNRTMTKSTMEWWSGQSDIAKNKSFIPRADDQGVKVGHSMMLDYMNRYDPERNQNIFIRGSLDQLCYDSLIRAAGLQELAPYYVYRDVRTAIDLLKETSNNGYCDVANFDKEYVIKHDPVHDCAFDIMMLKYGV